MSVYDAEPSDIYADATGKLWRVIAVCREPTVTVEEVEDTLVDPNARRNGTIPDEAVEIAGLTDDEIGRKIAEEYFHMVKARPCKAQYADMGRHARELLAPKHDEPAACVIADLTRQIAEWKARALAAERQEDVVTCGFKVRAERAEGELDEKLTKAASHMEYYLRLVDSRQADVGLSVAVERIAKDLGLTVRPKAVTSATVTWEGAK